MKNYRYLTSQKLKRRLLYICNKFGRHDEFQDIFHDYVLHILEGHGQHQTLDQFFVDYSRQKRWIDRNGNKNLIQLSEFDESYIAPVGDPCPFLYEYIDQLTGTERSLALYHYKYKLQLQELADIFGVEPSRISQIMNVIREKLRNAILE